MQDRAIAAGEGGRAPALRVGGLEEPAHEAEASLPDVGAAGEYVENGVDRTAEVGEGCDRRTASFGSIDH